MLLIIVLHSCLWAAPPHGVDIVDDDADAAAVAKQPAKRITPLHVRRLRVFNLPFTRGSSVEHEDQGT